MYSLRANEGVGLFGSLGAGLSGVAGLFGFSGFFVECGGDTPIRNTLMVVFNTFLFHRKLCEHKRLEVRFTKIVFLKIFRPPFP